MNHHLTLVDMLRAQSARKGPTLAYTYLLDGENAEQTLAYDALDRRARAIAVRLSAECTVGDRVLLLYPPGLEFIEGFFGCLYAGLVAVPAYPPDPSRLARTLPRLQAIAADAGAKVVATTAPLLAIAEMLFSQAPALGELRWIATDTAPGEGSEWARPDIDGATVAFLQYTSGSTGTPKGVVLSHGNLLANEGLIRRAFEHDDEGTIVVGWLPQYHDMGLIGNVIQPLYVGGRCVLMSPLDFLQRPMRWLRAISKHHATTSGGPNFAYDLCVRKSTPAERAELDLSSWRVAFTGAEPVRAETLQRFVEAFGRQGFAMESFYPCYGLAEASLIVSGGARGDLPVVTSVASDALGRDEVVERSGPGSQRFVSSGRELPGESIAVVDPERGVRCASGRIGEVWVSGDSVARGYWGQPERSAEVFGARLAGEARAYLRTGDLGFVRDGELFITGRLKDLIILRGRNLYPQDVETTVERSHPALRPGCTAAFSIDEAGEERLVIVQEVDRKAEDAALDEAIDRIRAAVAEQHEAQAWAVVLIEPGSISKTTSGKIQRYASRKQYLAGELKVRRSSQRGERGPPDELAVRVPPAAGMEQRLAEIIAERVEVPASAIDAERPLGAYGIDSLGTVELRAAIEERLGRTVPLEALLRGPSLRELAVLVEATEVASPAAPPPHAPLRGLTAGQRSLWLVYELEPDSAGYHLTASLRVIGALDADALGRAWTRVIERNPALRSTIEVVAGTPQRRVHRAAVPGSFSRADCDAATLDARATEAAQRRFDLRREAPLRVVLFSVDQRPARLVIVIHHIAADMWAIALVARQLGDAYAAETRGVALPWKPYREVDLSAEEAAFLASPAHARQLAYWRARLAGELPVLSLPLDRRRHGGGHRPAQSVSFELDEQSSAALRALGAQNHATLFSVVLAGYLALLHRYAQQRDLIVGIPLHGRTSAARAALVDYVINVVPLRVAVEADQPFTTLLAQVRARVSEALEHQDEPFSQIVESLHLQGERTPAFRTTFALQRLPAAARDQGLAGLVAGRAGARLLLGGMVLEAVPLQQRDAQFDLVVAMSDVGDRLIGAFEFDSTLFERDTIARMVDNFVVLLRELGRGAEVTTDRLALPDAERDLLVAWNERSRVASDDRRLVPARVADQGRRRADAPALTQGDRVVSWRELDARSNRLARALRARGVGPERLVGVCMARSIELVVVQTAILKAGGAFVALDAGHPDERIEAILADSGARLCFVDPGRTLAWAGEALNGQDGAEAYEAGPLPAGISAENAAYVVYTSGSTGKPKGVVMSHGALANFVDFYATAFAMTESDRHASLANAGFDALMMELWPTLAVGATVVIAPEEVRAAPEQLAEWYAAERVTHTFITTALFELLQRAPAPARSSMRVMLAGGEAMRTILPRPYPIYNVYGPTETCILSTYVPIAPDPSRRIPIGKPLYNVSTHIVDEQLMSVPIGAVGELCIGGRGVARGYLDRPELTAERFVPDPFGPAGARMYRSGDLARFRGDGNIEFIGRRDHQVKIRGFRLELGEVESAISRLEGVREVLVLARDTEGTKRLVAYVVGEVDAMGLRAALKASLPDYMVPAAFVVLDAMPLNANGKVDRRALPEPGQEVEARAYVAPRTPTEQLVARVWAEVLGVGRVGADDDFFDLGGHSLMATQVVSRIRAELGVELPVRALFEASTVVGLAERATHAQRTQAPLLVPQPRGERPPLSFAQERLWFLDQLEPGSVAYHMPGAVRLLGELNLDALRAALEEVVRRHENLRTTFAGQDGRAYLRLGEVATFPLPVEDLAAGEDPLERARQEWERPFDLAQGPLLRVAILRRSPREHVLVLTMHHIVSDGWSIGILVSEIGALYEAALRGQPSPLPPLPLQYADYAAWQRSWLQGEVLERELAYWKAQLAGAPALLELPTDRPRPAVQRFAGRRVAFTLGAELTAGLQRLTHEQGATLYMTLLAAWQVLLSRYSGQEDVVVGSPIANRTRKEVEGLIGFFVNMLILRTQLGGQPSFREVLERVKRTTLEAYSHQEVPFERIVEALNPERRLSHSPLFQVTFGLQNVPTGPLVLPGLTLAQLEPEVVAAKFDLVLNLAEVDGGLHGTLEYATDLFDDSTARRMIASLHLLLEGVVAAPDRPVLELAILAGPERAQLEAWSQGPLSTVGASVVEAIARQAARRPDEPAIVAAGQTLSFRTLAARAAGVAAALRDAGVAPEARVGLFLDRRVEMGVAILGAWNAGAAYVPFEPNAPLARMSAICERAGISCILTTRALSPRLAGLSLRLVIVDELGEVPARDLPSPAAGALAYVLFTSGSTGEPKGVAVTHDSLANLVGALNERIYAALEARLGGRPLRLGVNASYSFDSSVKQWVMLAHGHALAIVPEDARYDGRALLRFVAEQRIDVLDCTPAQLRPMLEVEGGVLPSALLIGGEAIDHALWLRLAALADSDVFDVYGPTECTVDSTIARVTGPTPTIGRAVAGTSAYVLDGAGRIAPLGVTGELCIGGRGVARGYLGRPDLTAERFVPDPFSATPGERMYRTGDLARYRSDGNLEFLGRLDQQVKVRGFRIELGEIESALGRVAGVREAAVLARQEGEGRRLVAYFVGNVESGAIKAALEETLPEYMVPTAFAKLDALPRTANGKIDRKALPEPSANVATGGYVAPRNPAEELIAAAWAEVLELERVGVNDDFFELGGHSLLATQVISRVQAGFDIEMPVSVLFETPTVAALAERVATAQRNRVPSLGEVERGERPPLSFAQERLWFLDQLEPGSSAYHVPAAVRVLGPLDVEALRRTLEEVVRRHESLRTTFSAFDGRPYQVVQPIERFELPVEVVERGDAIARARAIWAQPFDLSASPQIAATLLRVGDEEHLLVVAMHHIVSDGWSTGVLLREVAPLYQAFHEGRPSPLPPLALQYADYAAWQRRWLQGEVLEAELAYWKQKLAGAPPVLELPLDRPRPAVQQFAGRRVPVVIPAALTRAINTLSRREGATLYMTLLAAWQLVLSRYSGQEDVVVGSPIANRTRQEVEDLIGFFANTLVLRTRLNGRPTFRELLARVKRTTLEAYEHQEVPFERVVEALNPPRSMSHTPLFQVLFAMQNAPMGEMGLGGLRLEHIDPERETAKFDLLLNLIERDDQIVGTLEYASELFDEVSVVRLVDSFRTLLAAAVQTPEAAASSLPLMADAQRARLVLGVGADAAIGHALAHHYVEAQVQATPDAIAVVDGRRRWTYREIDDRAAQIAAYLQSLGIGAEERVGLALERNADATAATIGVLKAGAVCVPLETANPAERIAFMLRESGARVVLTHGKLRPLVESSGVKIVELDREWSQVEAAGHRYRARGRAESLLYVIYTSGSTGRPKGVALPHRALCNLLDVQLRTLPMGQRTLQFVSQGFDVSYQEIFATLGSGGALYYLDEDLRLDVERLGAFLTEQRIERAYLPVVMFQALAERFAGDDGALASLRDVITAGEQLVITDAVIRLFERLPTARLHNHYGPSETHVITTHTLAGAPSRWPGHAPIGAPNPNSSVRVLDPELGLQPPGAIGELYLGGLMLARGYLGGPELTAERFLPDPYASEPGARMYRSGDLGRRRNDGALEYLGRADQQVKVRGFRIELGEVESALGRVEGVREAVVVAREDHGERRLVAYVVGGSDPQALRAKLRQTLPDFMVPTAFVALARIPLNVNGKVDRRALPAPTIAPLQIVPPETDVQRALCEIWQETLHLERVGIDDNYFDLGGDSIRSVQVATRARARGIGLAVRDLFRSQTIRELSAVVRTLEPARGPAPDASGLSSTQVDALQARLRERARSRDKGGTGKR